MSSGRPAVALTVALALALTGNHGMAVAAEPASPGPAGMTWTVLGQQDGHVHVGADRRTDDDLGDTPAERYQPILCLKVDVPVVPAGVKADADSGWARGSVRVTPEVRGEQLTSRARADGLCATAFGAGWRMAGMHDGRYGKDLARASTGSFWANGSLLAGMRFWVSAEDRPANPWNSAGKRTAAQASVPSGGSEDDYILRSYLDQLVGPLLYLSDNPQFQATVRYAVSRSYGGDTQVLLSDLINDLEQAGLADPANPDWVDLKNAPERFRNVNGQSYAPQIYIPNYGEGAQPGPDVQVAVFDSDVAHTEVAGFQLDAAGGLMYLDYPLTEAYVETHEVWVLSVNESPATEPIPTRHATASGARPAAAPAPAGPAVAATSVAATDTVPCNQTGLRNNKGREYLLKLRIPDPRLYESWTQGKMEPWLKILTKGGGELANLQFGKVKRKAIKNGVDVDTFVGSWDRAIYGDYMAYVWVEHDSSEKEDTFEVGFSNEQAENMSVTTKYTVKFKQGDEPMGHRLVNFEESTYLPYATGALNAGVRWNVCSVGGDGASGIDNIAPSAVVAASSTYPTEGYAPARVIDGDADMRLGGQYSWTNARAAGPPQWIQLDFGSVKTFDKVVVFTSAGHEIRDFDVQVWTGTTWTTPPAAPGVTGGSVRGNTATSVMLTLAAQSSRLVRIMGYSGPLKQRHFIRVNEFQVY